MLQASLDGIMCSQGKVPAGEKRGKEKVNMPLYMTQFAYTKEAWATLTHNPEDRSVTVRELMETGGGRLLSWYLCFGEYDGLLIYEAPDDATAGALILAAATREHLGVTKTTPLFTGEESLEMMRRAGGMAFRAQGDQEGEPPESPGEL